MSNAYLTEEERADRFRPSQRPESSYSAYDTPHHPHRNSSYASYNEPLRPSIHEPYTDRDEPFDVRADFDGDGPRWSDLYGQSSGALLKDKEIGMGEEEYKRLDSHIAPSGQMMAYGSVDPMAYNAKSGYNKIEEGREELVSVPVLGPE